MHQTPKETAPSIPISQTSIVFERKRTNPSPEAATVLRRPALAWPRFRRSPLRYALDKIAPTGENFTSDEIQLSYRRLRRGRSGRGSSRWHTSSSSSFASSQESGICKKCHTNHQSQQQCGMMNFTARLVAVTSFNINKSTA